MKRSVASMLATLALLGAAACGPKNLHESFGLRYNAVFSTQMSERQSRDVAPLKGEEAQRIIQSYYETLAPKDGDSDSGGSGPISFSPPKMGQNLQIRAR